MATQLCINSPFTLNSPISYCRSPVKIHQFQPLFRYTNNSDSRNSNTLISIRCSSAKPTEALRTCKNCKAQFDPSLNDPRSCRYHTAHFGGIKFSFCLLVFYNLLFIRMLMIYMTSLKILNWGYAAGLVQFGVCCVLVNRNSY